MKSKYYHENIYFLNYSTLKFSNYELFHTSGISLLNVVTGTDEGNPFGRTLSLYKCNKSLVPLCGSR